MLLGRKRGSNNFKFHFTDLIPSLIEEAFLRWTGNSGMHFYNFE